MKTYNVWIEVEEIDEETGKVTEGFVLPDKLYSGRGKRGEAEAFHLVSGLVLQMTDSSTIASSDHVRRSVALIKNILDGPNTSAEQVRPE